ncbi:MAG: PilZ domain-containing protein [Deltaproteobacteria bacterium]|nr:PilZ domain-containing protein [Deltaproteobacteria bacterium]
MTEQRSLPRVPLDAEVTLHDSVSDVVAHGRVTNITMEGISVSSDVPFTPGQELKLRVVAEEDREAGLEEAMVATLQVLRCSEEGPPFEVAGHFLELSLP